MRPGTGSRRSSTGSSNVLTPRPPSVASTASRASATVRCQSASTARLNQRREKALHFILEEPAPSLTSPSTSAPRSSTNNNAGGGDKQTHLHTFKTQVPSISTRGNTPRGGSAGSNNRRPEVKSPTTGKATTSRGGVAAGSPVRNLLNDMVSRGVARKPRATGPEGAGGGMDSGGGAEGAGKDYEWERSSAGGGASEDESIGDDELREGRHRAFVPASLISKRAEHRIEFYRQNTTQRKLLRDRVRHYNELARGRPLQRYDEEYGIPILSEDEIEERRLRFEGRSIYDVFLEDREQQYHSLRISPRDGPTWIEKNAARHNHHKATASRVWREELAHKKGVIARHDQHLRAAEEQRRKAELSIVACEWENLLAVVVRGRLFLRNMLLLNAFNKLQWIRSTRSRFFQQWMRPVHKLMNQRRWAYVRSRIRIAIWAARVWAHISVRRNSVQTVVRFIVHMKEAGRFHIAVQHFRKKILRCQDIVRRFLHFRSVRLNLLLMMWEKKETTLRYRLNEQSKVEARKKNAASMALEQQQRGRGGGAAAGKLSLSASAVLNSSGAGTPRRPTVTASTSFHSTKAGRRGGKSVEEQEAFQQSRITELVKNDPFSYETGIPFAVRLKALESDWVRRRKQFIGKDMMVAYYADKMEYDKKVEERETLAFAGLTKSLPPLPKPPTYRSFPLFLPSDKFDELILKTYNAFKEDLMDLRFNVASAIVRSGRPETEYFPTRDNAMNDRFSHDVIERRQFYARLRHIVFSSPSVKEVLPPTGSGRPKKRLSIFSVNG